MVDPYFDALLTRIYTICLSSSDRTIPSASA